MLPLLPPPFSLFPFPPSGDGGVQSSVRPVGSGVTRGGFPGPLVYVHMHLLVPLPTEPR